ncbi:hypothetical protein KVV02_001937 [Mortierella alpina]|uniref:Uncharacterized protein n=1 Tax=Mortierella alpina TaxID=64518 RepID=A0A9P8CWV9_MORAP|nr:hypothetical protein KVV02_001937 [Mortierella alpina]
MGWGPYDVLKTTLWIQAALLIVLTSLLADSGAWIGTIITATGLCFVITGIGAAFKKSLGYLYSYATLVGVWGLLAIIHTLLICGLVSVPATTINPILVLGQRIVNNSSDPMKIVLPVLYAVQELAWCISLVCLVCLRVAEDDPTLGFDIQKRRSTRKKSSVTHKLGAAQQSADGYRESSRISQRLFGWRRSVVAPLRRSDTSSYPDPEKQQRQESQHAIYDLEEPQTGWDAKEKRESNDSSTIYFPRGRRISQVVVTFKDTIEEAYPEKVHSSSTHAVTCADAASATKQMQFSPAENNDLQARRVLIADPADSFVKLPFTQPGESLSDMIFKVVQQPLFNEPSLKDKVSTIVTRELAGRVSNESDLTDADTKAESPTLSTTTTLDGHAATYERDHSQEQDHAVEGLAMTTAAGSSVNLSKGQLEQLEQLQQQRKQNAASWQLLMEQDQQQEAHEQDDREEVCSVDPKTSSFCSFPVVPARRSSFGRSLPERLESIGEDEEGDLGDDLDRCRQSSGYGADEPCIQPNITSAHPFSDSRTAAPSCSGFEPVPPPRPKPSLASLPLQYWRNRGSSSQQISEDPAPSPSISFNLVNTFSKKKKQQQSTTPPPPLRAPHIPPIIPTIVLHPDDEDGEPARVLSDLEIEYLSTMPATPLRLLVQPWDENEEDGYYDDYHQEYEQDDGGDDRDETIDQEVSAPASEIKVCEAGDTDYYDPYALDVPINLEIDLQGLEHGDLAKTTYGYI